MNNTLSLTTASAALVLFATTLLAPTQASAADRQISVNPNLAKLKTFTVNTSKNEEAVEVANTAPEAPANVKPKAFRVDDEAEAAPQANNNDDVEQAEVEERQQPKAPKITPKKQKVQEFRVDDESGEVADTPSQDDGEDDVATAPPVRPANKLNKKIKTAQPAVDEDEQAAAIADDQEDAVAADQPEEAAAPAEEEDVATAEEDNDDEPTILKKVSHKKRYKSYVVKHNTYTPYQEDYGYQQQSYDAPSCHNNYNY